MKRRVTVTGREGTTKVCCRAIATRCRDGYSWLVGSVALYVCVTLVSVGVKDKRGEIDVIHLTLTFLLCNFVTCNNNFVTYSDTPCCAGQKLKSRASPLLCAHETSASYLVSIYLQSFNFRFQPKC